MLKRIRSSILLKLGFLFCFIAFLTISSIFYTVYTFRVLKGVSRSVDISGSERMRSILLSALIQEYTDEVQKNEGLLNERALNLKHIISDELETYEVYLNGLIHGSDALGLIKVNEEVLLDNLQILKREFLQWKKYIAQAIRPESTEADRTATSAKLSIENAIHLKQTAHKVVTLFENRFRENIRQLKNIQKIILGVTVLVSIFSIYLLYRIVRPIKDVLGITNRMSQGKLTENLDIDLPDEIGVLAQAINRTILEWRKILRQLLDSSGKLFLSSSSISMSVTEITTGAKNQVEQVIETSEAMEEMTKYIEEVSINARNTTDYAKTASQKLQQGKLACGETIETIRKANERMQELNRESAEIGKIVQFISEFAEQTSLLAINASIEAERAGVHGRGFDVVADEIRKLARRTSKFTSDIIIVLEDIQQKLIDVTKIMNEGTNLVESTGSFLEAVTEDVSRTADRVNLISTASGRQVDISEKIAASLSLISEVSRETSDSSRGSAEEAKKMAALAEELKKITNKFQINGDLSGKS